MALRFELTDQRDEQFIARLANLLTQFNDDRSGFPYDGSLLAIPLTDAGQVVGGLLSSTSYSWLHVDVLFIPEERRGEGLGRKLLALAESEARRRGCTASWLDTFSFQARGFYEKMGYAVFGELADYPPGQGRFFLKKDIAGPVIHP